jgi:hypothetical protein
LLKKFKQTKQANPTPEPQDLFMPERITEREDCLIINNIFLRTLVVDMLPEQVHFGWLASVSSIPGVTVSITIHPYTHEQASNRISRQQTILGSELIRAEKENNTRRIDVLNLKYHFYRELLKEINLRRTNIVSLTATIAVAASTHDYLNKKCAKIQDMLRATRLKTLYLKQVDGIKTLLPGVDSIDEYHDATIANAACLSPLISTNLSHPSGVYFGLNESGSPCFLDLFSGSPRLFGPHMFLTGTTRSGKSFTMKGIIARSMALGRRVVVLDPEGEYEKLTQTMEGIHIRLHASMKPMFNPFDIEPSYDKSLGYYLDIPTKVDDIVSLIGTMLESQSGEKLSAEERAIINRAVRAEYESRGIYDNDPSSIYDKGGVETEEGVMVGKVLKEMPTFSSLKNRLESPKLVNILSDYCAGGPMGFFDGQSQGKLQDSHLVCIDISALGNEYSKMFAMSVMLAWLWDKFAKPHKEIKKHIVVDEAWLFMNYKYSAVFLSQIARRGAKYNTSLMAASQSFREFLTQEGITFLNQCDTKFFLRMQKNDALALGDLFGLSPQLIERIIAFPNGRGVLRAGNESAVIQFKGFAFEEEFLESNPEAVVSR